MPRGCLQFVIVVFPDHTHLLFFIKLSEKARQLREKRSNSEFLKLLVIFKKMSLLKIPVKPHISQNLTCLLLFLFAWSRQTTLK